MDLINAGHAYHVCTAMPLCPKVLLVTEALEKQEPQASFSLCDGEKVIHHTVSSESPVTGQGQRIHRSIAFRYTLKNLAKLCLETGSLSFSPRTRWVTLGQLMVLFDLQLLARSQDKSQSQENPLTVLFINQGRLPMVKMGKFFPHLHSPEHFLHGKTSCIALTR